MNVTQVVDERVEAYVDEVSRVLAGLDAEDRAALVDDVREHAAAILADDPGVDLPTRLGPPEAFGRELLDSAGIVVPGRPARLGWRARCARIRDGRLGRIAARAATDFAPMWAALRGVAAVWVLTSLLNAELGQALPLLLAAGAFAGWLTSARFAEIRRRGRLGRATGFAADVATLVAGLILFGSWAGSITPQSRYGEPLAAEPAGLTLDGAPLTGIQAFGPDGQAAPVMLFDPYGNPLTIDPMGTDNLSCAPGLTVVTVPYLSSSGQPIRNAFPARGICVDDEYTVVGNATVLTNGAAVRTWSTAGLPTPGQKIIVDDFGGYAGLEAGSPQASASAAAGAPSPSPSASR